MDEDPVACSPEAKRGRPLTAFPQVGGPFDCLNSVRARRDSNP